MWVCFYKLIIHCLCKLRFKWSETPCRKALNVLTLSENIKTYSSISLEAFREIIRQLFLIVFFEKNNWCIIQIYSPMILIYRRVIFIYWRIKSNNSAILTFTGMGFYGSVKCLSSFSGCKNNDSNIIPQEY